MKTQYKINEPWGWIGYDGTWYEHSTPGKYEHRFITMRYPKTQHERSANLRDKQYVRGRRRKLPSNWDDLNPSFTYASCWKRFTKQRKQWKPK
jgi:hypothetical protein